MEWCKLYARFPDDVSIQHVGERAGWLFILGLCYCAQEETDGFVPRTQLSRFGLRSVGKRVADLVAEGLWTEVPDGWVVTRWTELQKSSDQVERRREADRKRQQRRRASRRDTQRDVQRDSRGVSRSLESESDLVVKSVGQVSESNARASDDWDLKILEAIVTTLRAATGKTVDLDWAKRVAAQLLAGRTVKNPAGYVVTSIRENPDRYVPTPQPPPVADLFPMPS